MIYIIFYIFIETFVSVEIASAIGPFWTFIEIILSAILGLFLIINHQYRLGEYFFALFKKEISNEEFEALNLYSLLGAILLIIPGFFTDTVGMLLQFGIFAKFFAVKILNLKRKKKDGGDDVIDVEIIED